MNRITLALLGLVAAGVATAQDPVPTRPALPSTPIVAPVPAVPAVPAVEPIGPRGFAPRALLDDDMRAARDMAIDQARLNAEMAREQGRINADMAREQSRINADMAHAQIEANRIAAMDAREANRLAAKAQRMAVDATRDFEPLAAMAPIASMEPMVAAMAPLAPFGRLYQDDRLDRRTPPQAWAQGDPADSLYRVARSVLTAGDWGRAARMFADLQKTYPKSAYQNESQYWEAWARYKIGTTDELRSAARILEPLASKITPPTSGESSGQRMYYDGRRTSDSEVLALYARINGALAQRGDRDAAAKVERAAQQQGAPCDREDIQVRTEALNALSQMDPTQALPILRRVIDRKDDCSAELRRNAVFILGRRTDADAQNILMNVAKSDPNISVRTEAINYLSRIPGDAGLNALEEMLRSEQDERVQRAAVHALMASDSPRARSSMRALIDRKDSPLNLRIEAINSFNSERATNDDAAYLRGLFGKADNDQMKNAIVRAVARMGGSENDQWVISIARNNNESSSVRSNALSLLSRSPTITTADLMKLYDASSESAEIRNRIISMLGARKDQEATDKLIDIVRTSTVVDNRTRAIVALRDKKDPRATQALMDILDGKKP